MSAECVKRPAAEENREVRPLIIDRLSPAARTFGKNFWAKTLFGEDTGKSKEPSAMLFQCSLFTDGRNYWKTLFLLQISIFLFLNDLRI